MTPDAFDREQVGRRLRTMRQTLDQLELLRGVGADRLDAEPLTRAAAERLLQVIVDLAVDINGHIGAGLLGAAPATGRDSFRSAAEAEAIDAALAERLAPAAGLRNLLVHRYGDIRVDLVAAAVPEVLDGFADYVGQVARFTDGDA